MAKYDGLIIPRSYNDYINKSDPLGVAQALQLTGVMDAAPTAASTKPAKSGGIFAANAVIMASSATLTGVAISAGSVVRILFTADLTGSNTTTGLTLTYNGNAYAVKVGKNGALAAFVASEISSGVFKYLQAYTTLELMFDGTQFIIIGNPVVLSSTDYTIYADGKGAGGLVFPSLSEFSTVYCDPHCQRLWHSQCKGSNPMSKERWLCGCRRTERIYSTFKVRRGGCEEIPLV